MHHNMSFNPTQRSQKIYLFSTFSYHHKNNQTSRLYRKATQHGWSYPYIVLQEWLSLWAMWNSFINMDSLPQQTECYLQYISLFSTRVDVVVEMLRIAQNVATKCSERYAVITYYLAIAKLHFRYKGQNRNILIIYSSCLVHFTSWWHTSVSMGSVLMEVAEVLLCWIMKYLHQIC